MRGTFIPLVAAVALACGCSKKPAAAPEAAAEAATPAVAPQDPAILNASFEDLDRKVQQQQYDAAVGSLVSLAQMPKSDAQEARFRARLRETETALLKKAQAGDVAAQQSAQMLGRMMTGR